jgi:hypothetical protein
MHRLATAADTLQRALERYSSNTPSHTGEYRTTEDIERMWRDFAMCLLDVYDRGRRLTFQFPMPNDSRSWLKSEMEDHEPSEWLREALEDAR